ncbi:Mobile element protein [Candidatus Enterovibrio escicola]|uniref:Mobile element protein n=1 Tax=Candidatus Enterovibrio escicola TaxID=1927127 RepID=A0A2A5T7P8_9GAMM|nr:Mobile element protein [Candidatus Enterovibrio escacola]
MRFYLYCLIHYDERYSKSVLMDPIDTKACYHVLKNKGITPSIPP